MKKHAITKAQIERAMKAANECGQPVRQIVMTSDEVRLIYDEGVDGDDSRFRLMAPSNGHGARYEDRSAEFAA